MAVLAIGDGAYLYVTSVMGLVTFNLDGRSALGKAYLVFRCLIRRRHSPNSMYESFYVLSNNRLCGLCLFIN